MFKIVKSFGPFAAAHHLTRVPAGHQCARDHGHNYMIEVELQSPMLNEHGFVVDYGDLKPFEEYAQARMDHRNLNREFACEPTAENLARHFFWWIRGTQDWPVVAVRVSETPGKTMSEFRADEPTPPTALIVQISMDTEIHIEQTNIQIVEVNLAPANEEEEDPPMAASTALINYLPGALPSNGELRLIA